MKTELVYLNDTYLFELDSKIIAINKDDKGTYIIFDRTIFYPQGGGQPSDTGIITVLEKQFFIHHAEYENEYVKHYLHDDINNNLIEQKVVMKIDKEKRLINARLHTSAHLISHIVEELLPNIHAIKGHQYPDNAYVEFEGDVVQFNDAQLEHVSNELKKLIQAGMQTQTKFLTPIEVQEISENLPYQLPTDKPIRALFIGNYSPTPCGGTHLKNINEIKNIELIKYKIKKNRLKLNYQIS